MTRSNVSRRIEGLRHCDFRGKPTYSAGKPKGAFAALERVQDERALDRQRDLDELPLCQSRHRQANESGGSQQTS